MSYHESDTELSPAEFVLANREKLVAAFIAETGLKPSECELVEEILPMGGVRVHVRKRP